MYSGSSLESNAENVVSKAMLNMKMQTNDISKGIMLGNILRNNKKNPDILNKLLCEFSLDSTISETASQLIVTIANKVGETLPQLITSLVQALSEFVNTPPPICLTITPLLCELSQMFKQL